MSTSDQSEGSEADPKLQSNHVGSSPASHAVVNQTTQLATYWRLMATITVNIEIINGLISMLQE